MSAGLNVYVAVFLFRKNRVLLLERGSRKRFAPGRWTGVGGRAEAGEINDLETAAFREVSEEAGIEAEDIENLEIRVVLTRFEDGDVTTVVFFSGHTDRESLQECNEGRLRWIELDRVDDLDLVENARYALNLALKAEESACPGLFLAVEDAACGGAIRAVRVNPTVSGNSAGTRETQ
ncbi:MAG: NUDIX domain-containing protein [Gemmatimonadota bacterium]|nr:NUDIX domain-containing protein [Gemmatimonadota bacterium]